LICFFKRCLGRNGSSTPELINRITRQIINGNTVKFQKIGVRKNVKFEVFNQEKDKKKSQLLDLEIRQ